MGAYAISKTPTLTFKRHFDPTVNHGQICSQRRRSIHGSIIDTCGRNPLFIVDGVAISSKRSVGTAPGMLAGRSKDDNVYFDLPAEILLKQWQLRSTITTSKLTNGSVTVMYLTRLQSPAKLTDNDYQSPNTSGSCLKNAFLQSIKIKWKGLLK